MKKTLIIAFISIFALRAACDFSAPRENANDPKVMTDAQAIAADKDSLEIGYADGDSEGYVTQNVNLPTSGISGTTITWTSDKANISAAASTFGKVTRPTFGLSNVDTTLTATITRGNSTDTTTFTLTVVALSAICAATSSNGVFISDDQGATWDNYIHNAADSTTIASDTVYKVYTSGSTIYAATNAGLSKSTNGGVSWTTYTTSNGLGSNTVYDVFITVVSVKGTLIRTTTIYAATSGGLSKSTNGGTSWTNYTTSNGLLSNTVNAVFVHISTFLEVTTITIYAGTGSGLSTSTDGGTTWTNYTTTNGLVNNNVKDVIATGTLFKSIYVATSGGLSISTNSGSSWTSYTTGPDQIANNDVHSVLYISSAIYASTHGGLSRTTNSGTTWTTISTNASTIVNDIFVLGLNLYVATSTGLAISNTNGTSWVTPLKLSGYSINSVSVK
jgi:hypothetical protein